MAEYRRQESEYRITSRILNTNAGIADWGKFVENFHQLFTNLTFTMIDTDGFRANVGIMLCNDQGKLFWARRAGMDAWQFPQGGIKSDEDAETAMYRELREEIGLLPEHVEVIGSTDDWLRYWLPKRFIRQNIEPLCIGQKQIWFLLKLVTDDSKVNLSISRKPEFDHWEWIDYWEPVKLVVAFKRNVYEEALKQFAPYLFP